MSFAGNNHLFNFRLFPRRNVEIPNGYEDLRVVQFENNDNCDYNAPSTSTALRPLSRTRQIANNRNVSCVDVRKNIEQSGVILPSSVRRYANGSVRRDHGVSSQDIPLTSNSLRNTSTLPRTFEVSSRSSVLNTDSSQWNNGRVNQDARYTSNNDYVNITLGRETFDAGFGRRIAGGNTVLQESSMANHNVNLTLCRRSNSHVLAVSTNHGRAKSTFECGLQIEESFQYNEGDMLNQRFHKPTLSRELKCRNLTIPKKIFSPQNVENHSQDFSNINAFNWTHMSRRDQDNFSESRFPLRQKNMLNVISCDTSLPSVKDQVMNILENLHHSILNIAPNIPANVVQIEFTKARRGLESIHEMSYAPTIRETDAASVTSHSSRFQHSALPHPVLGTKSGSNLFLKSGGEVLNLLKGKMAQNNLVLSETNEEESTAIHDTEFQDQVSVNQNKDTVPIFKKPKPVCSKKKGGMELRIRTPQETKKPSFKSRIKSNIISLREWYPVAVGCDLVFCGIDDGGTTLQTEPVKKRVTNRKLELKNGLQCNLVGNPSDCIVSAFPKSILSVLRDGLPSRWKVFQTNLQNVQSPTVLNRKQQLRYRSSLDTGAKKSPSNKESSEVYVNTPKTRKRIPREKQKGEDESHSTPVRAVAVKSNFKTAIRSAAETARIREKRGLGRVEKKTDTSPEKEDSIVKERKGKESAEEKSCPQKDGKGAVSHTRSGRTVKPPSKFWLVQLPDSSIVGAPQKVTVNKEPGKREKENIMEESSGKKPSGDDVEQKEPEGAKLRTKKESQAKRKREVVEDADSTTRKRSKCEETPKPVVESRIDVGKSGKNAKESESKLIRRGRPPLVQKKDNKKSPSVKKDGKESSYLEEDDFELQLEDIEIPEMANVSGKPQLNRSLLQLVSMETPPLKYFNYNLRMRNMTPESTPNWCISKRTNSEVKQFQIRRAQAQKRKGKTNKGKEEKTKKVAHSKDLKSVLNWVAEKEVRTPVGCSQVLKYLIPSRKLMEETDEEEEEEEEFEM